VGGIHHRFVEGGHWWLDFEIEVAERPGDAERVRTLKAEASAERDKSLAEGLARIAELRRGSRSKLVLWSPADRGRGSSRQATVRISATPASTRPPESWPSIERRPRRLRLPWSRRSIDAPAGARRVRGAQHLAGGAQNRLDLLPQLLPWRRIKQT
jgi:hypothetical protein